MAPARSPRPTRTTEAGRRGGGGVVAFKWRQSHARHEPRRRRIFDRFSGEIQRLGARSGVVFIAVLCAEHNVGRTILALE
ncbi:hypothetical protein Dimus_039599 [Dionaea muscipula]